MSAELERLKAVREKILKWNDPVLECPELRTLSDQMFAHIERLEKKLGECADELVSALHLLDLEYGEENLNPAKTVAPYRELLK